MLPLYLVAGPQKIWTVTLKSAHINNFFKPAIGGNAFLDFFKAKNEENENKYLYIKQFCPFSKNKNNIKRDFFSNYIFVDCSFIIYTEFLCNFQI